MPVIFKSFFVSPWVASFGWAKSFFTSVVEKPWLLLKWIKEAHIVSFWDKMKYFLHMAPCLVARPCTFSVNGMRSVLFFASVSPSNCEIFDTQSSQMRQLRKKMREGNELCHSLTYTRLCFVPPHRYNMLQKARFMDIKVLIDMIVSNLFQSNEEIEAVSRQIWLEFFKCTFSIFFL